LRIEKNRDGARIALRAFSILHFQFSVCARA